MTNIDYKTLYGLRDLDESIQERLRRLNGDNSRLNSLDAALRVETKTPYYTVRRKRGTERINFSADNFKAKSPNILLLSETKGLWPFRLEKKVVALGYYPSKKGIWIQFAQSVSGIGLEQYQSFQKRIGIRPHELLVAHLVARVAPILDKYPDMNIEFPEIDINLPGKREAQRIINERFAGKTNPNDNTYELNPRKDRVKQIFGEDSPWLKENRQKFYR